MMKMSMEQREEAYQVRVVLEGEMARRFATIKKRYGLESNAEVVRLLITLEYDRIANTGSRGKFVSGSL